MKAGGYRATEIDAQNMTCRSARRKLRRWLQRGSLPENQYGWYCGRSSGHRICSGGNGGGAPHFTFKLRGLASSADVVRDCKTFKHIVAWVYDRSVRNMSCARAGRLTRGSYGRNGWHWRAAREAGFSCGRIDEVYEGTTYRCVNGSKAFRFTFGV